MNITPTELNRRLSQWVQSRIAADNSLNNGRVYFWRCFGVGLGTLGLGTALGLAFYGYSFITKNKENINNLSVAFSKALADAKLEATAEGTVQIEPREIALAKDQAISLDKNSRVRLDPAATVLADGDIRIQMPPTVSVPRTSTPSSAGVPNITNFTVFKSVLFDKGSVMTGWTFLTSAQKTPTEEYCYYSVNTETPGVGIKLDLGRNRKPEIPESIPASFDVNAAYERCVWFRTESQ
jgi:hypothetical protein